VAIITVLTQKEVVKKFTPGFDRYAVDVWETGGNYRPDSLEYYSVDYIESTEKALFGELSYQFTDKLDITVGARFYQYDVAIKSDVDFPLLYTSIVPEGDDGIFVAVMKLYLIC